MALIGALAHPSSIYHAEMSAHGSGNPPMVQLGLWEPYAGRPEASAQHHQAPSSSLN